MEDPHCELQCKKLGSSFLFSFIKKFLLSIYYMPNIMELGIQSKQNRQKSLPL